MESELASLPALPAIEAALDAARAALDEARRQGEQTIEAAREAERYESDAARQAVAKAEAERIEMEHARADERLAAEASHAAAAEALQKTNVRLTKLRAEEAGVAAALQSAADLLWPPLLDALTRRAGLRKGAGRGLRRRPRGLVRSRRAGSLAAARQRWPVRRRCRKAPRPCRRM